MLILRGTTFDLFYLLNLFCFILIMFFIYENYLEMEDPNHLVLILVYCVFLKILYSCHNSCDMVFVD